MKALVSLRWAAAAWLATAAIVTLGASGCGSSTPSAHLRVLTPADGSSTSADRMTVRGTITPENAAVEVAGQSAQVNAGVFTTSVPLRPGSNQLDVVATVEGGTPVSTTVAVTREKLSTASTSATQQPQSAPSQLPASDSSPVASSSPASNASSADRSSPEGTDCGGGLHAGPNTTCPFAENVRAAYDEAPGAYVQAYSPVTNKSYSMDCTPVGAGVSCHGGNDATVSW